MAVTCGISWHVVMLFLLCVCREEVDALARRLRLKLFRTSVKENFNVEQGVRGGRRKGRQEVEIRGRKKGKKRDGWEEGGGVWGRFIFLRCECTSVLSVFSKDCFHLPAGSLV